MLRTCCKQLPGTINQLSPFTKLITLDYYDGPKAGVALCEECLSEYVFELLVMDGQECLRVYSFSLLPLGSFASLVNELKVLSTPKWPVWIPWWRFSDEAKRKQAEFLIEQVLTQANAPSLIVVAEKLYDLVLVSKSISSVDSHYLVLRNLRQLDQWLAFIRSP